MGCLASRTPLTPDIETHAAFIKQTLTSGVVNSKPRLAVSHLQWSEDEDEAFVSLLCREPEKVFALDDGELLKGFLVLMKHVGVLKMLSKPVTETTQFLVDFGLAHNEHPLSCLRNTLGVCIGYVKVFNIGRTTLAKYLNELDYCWGFLSCMAINVGHPGVSEDFLANTNDDLSLMYGGRNILARHTSAEFCSLLVARAMLDNLPRHERRAVLSCICANMINTAESSAADKAIELSLRSNKLSNSSSDRDFLRSYLVLSARLTLYSESYGIFQEWMSRQRREVERQQKLIEDIPEKTVMLPEENFLTSLVLPVFKALREVSSEYQIYVEQGSEVLREWRIAHVPMRKNPV